MRWRVENESRRGPSFSGTCLNRHKPGATCPVEGGEIPDCAGMIAAVEAVTDRKVEVIVGKPSPIILEVALAAKATARRNKLLGLWAAGLMGLSGADAEARLTQCYPSRSGSRSCAV